jgi:polyferredoxin
MKYAKKTFLRRAVTVALLLAVVLLFSSCLPGDGKNTVDKPANFLMGIWHGWVAPVSVILGIFKGNIRIYEVNNSGWWYDLGFYMAIISGFGGITLSRKNRKNRPS